MKKLKILAVLFVLVAITNVNATIFQSRPGVDADLKGTISYYFKNIREMEAEGGALGLNATINYNSGECLEITESNNIDSHMCKNTEWGTVAMLSASDYGAGNGNVKSNYNSTTKIYDVTASTTGNMTGVFGMNGGAAHTEHVAAGVTYYMDRVMCYVLKKAEIRYVDDYADGTDKKDFSRYIPGDATYETKTFSNGGGTFVVGGSWENGWFERSDLFEFHGSYDALGYGLANHGSRGCLWVGEGL